MKRFQFFYSLRQLATSASALKKPDRFYKSATVVSHRVDQKSLYNVILDDKKLKSPYGKLFETESKPLAYAVCQEWNHQNKLIRLDRMLLTKLSFAALDNPLSLKKEDVVKNIMEFLETDTILYRCNENEKLKKLQMHQWDPIIIWASERYSLDIKPTYSIVEVAELSEGSRKVIQRFLMGHSFPALLGIQLAVESITSLLLTLAVLAFRLEARKAVELALLEQQFQVESWGKVEWGHDVAFEEILSRLSAGILFAHFLSSVFHSEHLDLPFNSSIFLNYTELKALE